MLLEIEWEVKNENSYSYLERLVYFSELEWDFRCEIHAIHELINEERGATRKIPFSINQLLWRPLMIFPISNFFVCIPHFWFPIPGFDNSFSTLNRLSSIPNDSPALLISINQLPIRPFIFWKSPHFFRTKWEEPGHCNVLYNSACSFCGPGNTLY